jgi:sec-independent protein translocase protein TatA
MPYNGIDPEGGSMGTLQLPELMVILGIAVLLFGGKKIPEVAKGLGEGIRNFKNALKSEDKSAPAATVDEKKQA